MSFFSPYPGFHFVSIHRPTPANRAFSTSSEMLFKRLILPFFLASSPLSADQKLEAWVAPYKGRNVFFVNGKPLPPLMYSNTEQGRKTWQDPTRKSIREFTEQGYRIIQTDFWLKYSLSPDGTLDVEGIRKQLRGILDIEPQAMLVTRINVSAPAWWLQKHPGETCKVTKPGPDNNHFSGNRAESLASEKYRDFAHTHLEAFLSELARLPEGDRVIGIHIGGGVYGEWHYYGIFNEPDASEPMRHEFIRYARATYSTPEKLEAAWKTGFASFDDIVVPGYERRHQAADGEFLDPREDQYVIDYYHCQQRVISRLVESLAKTTRETWPRRVITGVFFGYFYGGFTVGAQAGQNDIETIFRSPHLDYFAAPYASRSMHGTGVFRSLAESVALNGKIWLTEHDGGTHLGGSGSGQGKFPDIPADESQTLARMRRTYMHHLAERGGQWWYDFGPRSQGGGWWSTPRLLKEAGDLLALSTRLMEDSFEKHADVLVVHSMASYHHYRPKRVEKLSGAAHEILADALLATGASFDKIFLMDLGKVDLSKYKLIIFSNTVLMTEEDRRLVRDHVLLDGRTVIFLSACGYTDGTVNDTKLISSLTGIEIAKTEALHPHLDLSLDGRKYRIPCKDFISLFKVTDKAATPVGSYDGRKTAVATKTVNGCQVWFFGAPPGKDPSPHRHLFAKAGVRFFVEDTADRDVVSVGGGIIGIYSVKGGEKTLRPLDGKPVEITMAPYSCAYFDIRTGAKLLED